ncbi:MAG: tripartite tricarboxylate transporter TctB family protein [Pseudomonadota bacterium]
MLLQRWANIVFMFIVLGAAAYFAWVAESFVAAGLLASAGLPAKFFPQLLLGLIAVCAVVVLLTYLFKGSSGGDEGALVYDKPRHAVRGLLTLAAVVAAYLIWREFGFIAMAAFIGPATLIAMGERNPIIYGVVLALAAGIYLVFTQVLGTQF